MDTWAMEFSKFIIISLDITVFTYWNANMCHLTVCVGIWFLSSNRVSHRVGYLRENWVIWAFWISECWVEGVWTVMESWNEIFDSLHRWTGVSLWISALPMISPLLGSCEIVWGYTGQHSQLFCECSHGRTLNKELHCCWSLQYSISWPTPRTQNTFDSRILFSFWESPISEWGLLD